MNKLDYLSSTMTFMWNTVWDEAGDIGKLLMVGAFPFWVFGYLLCFIVVDPFVFINNFAKGYYQIEAPKRLENVV